jgi:Protein of unknown function (DUF1488)
MSLQSSGHHLYEPLLGIVLFKMRDDGGLVHHCMVSECALRNRALVDGEPQDLIDDLFNSYRREVEAIAAQQYECGFNSPMVRAIDLAPPTPLPGGCGA